MLNNCVTMNSGLGVTESRWKWCWCCFKAWVQFPISIPQQLWPCR